MKVVADIAIVVGAISLVVGVVSRWTVAPVMGIEAHALLSFSIACLLLSIALSVREK
jgi:hypothetical protein